MPKLAPWHFVAALLVIAAGVYLSIRPSNDRVWSPDNARIPYAELNGTVVRVHNVRNAVYRSTDDYDVRWADRDYDIDAIRTAWFAVEPFSSHKGPAHTFVSFGFADGQYVAISVELRKEPGEHFNPLLGLLKQYELTYVVADERDVVKLRSNFRRDSVYLYPIRAPRELIRAMFVSMLDRANGLHERPEFYNTLTNTCTTNIAHHVNSIAPKRVPVSWKLLFPAYADRLAYDIGLIDTDLPFEAARERYKINERALKYADDPQFSRKIRGL